MNIPTNLKYTKDHEWIRLEGDNAYIGITDYAQHELGDIVFVDVDSLDETLEAEETFGTIEAVKTLADAPEKVNKDPYGEGWIIKVEVTNAAEMDNLLDAEGYKALIG